MRILQVCDYFNLQRPGGGTRLIQAHTVELRRRGHDVALLAGHDGDPPREAAPGIPMHAFPYPPRGGRGTLAALRRIRSLWRKIAGDGPPDLVVFHQPLSANLILDLVPRRSVPIIYMFHSPWSREHLAAGWGPFLQFGAAIRRGLERRALGRASRIVTLSRYMRGEARETHGLGDGRFALIPGGVDLQRYRPSPERDRLRGRLGVPQGILLFTLRRLVPRMGVEDLIRAVGALGDGPRKVHLWVGGTGPEAARLEGLARSVGRGRVRFLGPVSEEDGPDLYAAADIFVLPTRCLEGFGLVTLEALASGTPVIATPAGANREVIGDLDPDLITEGIGADAIAARLVEAQGGRWSDPGFRGRCRRYAEERYPWSRAVDRFESLAEEVLGTHT